MERVPVLDRVHRLGRLQVERSWGGSDQGPGTSGSQARLVAWRRHPEAGGGLDD